MSLIGQLSSIRASQPDAIKTALAARPRRQPVQPDERFLVLACDHPARGALGAGTDEMAMASREEVLDRCLRALSCPGVEGFLGTADLVEDLTLLGALDNKLVWGSMNRGGLMGATFEMDDRFTGYSAPGIADAGLDGGKMLVRINYQDAGSVRTLEKSAEAINALAERGLNAMVEPFISRWEGDTVVNDLSPDAVIHSMAIASGLGTTSASTWLKLPCVEEMERVMEASTLPALILGGALNGDAEKTYGKWAKALALPNVMGLVIGRSLLFPANGDVEGTVNRLVEML